VGESTPCLRRTPESAPIATGPFWAKSRSRSLFFSSTRSHRRSRRRVQLKSVTREADHFYVLCGTSVQNVTSEPGCPNVRKKVAVRSSVPLGQSSEPLATMFSPWPVAVRQLEIRRVKKRARDWTLAIEPYGARSRPKKEPDLKPDQRNQRSFFFSEPGLIRYAWLVPRLGQIGNRSQPIVRTTVSQCRVGGSPSRETAQSLAPLRCVPGLFYLWRPSSITSEGPSLEETPLLANQDRPPFKAVFLLVRLSVCTGSFA